jgi:predicted nucleotidyltransferase
VITDNEKEALVRWAHDKPFVKRLYIFGSRARGNHRPNSDLDIAVELDAEFLLNVDESGGLTTWIHGNRKWKQELEGMLSYTVQLEFYEGNKTPTIHKGLSESSVIVYEKG